MEEQNRGASASNYKQLSEELGKRLIKLYGLKIFPRQGKVFADLLFQTGVEAGTAIAALADLEDREEKLHLSNRAMVKLNETAYIIHIMREAGYYTLEDVLPLEEYVNGLIRAVKHVLAIAYAQRPAPQQLLAGQQIQNVQRVQQVQRVQHIHTYSGAQNAPASARHISESELARKLSQADVVKITDETAAAPVEETESEVTPAVEVSEAANLLEAQAEEEAVAQDETHTEEKQDETMADGFNDPVE